MSSGHYKSVDHVYRDTVPGAVLSVCDEFSTDLVPAPGKARREPALRESASPPKNRNERQTCSLPKRIVNRASKMNGTAPKHVLPYP